MKAVKLSQAQIEFMSLLKTVGKIKCMDKNRKTYNKLICLGFVQYDSSYDHVVLTKEGRELQL